MSLQNVKVLRKNIKEENYFSDENEQKIIGVLDRFILHHKAHLEVDDDDYSNSLKKIYIYLNKISDIWCVYEGLFCFLKKIKAKEFLTKKGTLKTNYTKTSNTLVSNSYSKEKKISTFFEDILSSIEKSEYNDGLLNLDTIVKLLEYFIKENVQRNKTTLNKLLKSIINKIKYIKVYKEGNHETSNPQPLDDAKKNLEWQELLAIVYCIRNHFYHNCLLGNEVVSNLKEEKFILEFLVNIYNIFLEIVTNVILEKIPENREIT